MKRIIAALALGASIAGPTWAQEQYTIGLSGLLTGPGASTTAPTIEAIRIYFDKVNAAGGINGRKVNLIIRDDQGEPSKGAANARRLLTENKVLLLVNNSLSSTYGSMMSETQRENVPLLFAGVCPKDVFPPAKPLFFCSTAFASNYDSRAALDFIKERGGGGEIKIGFNAMTVPVSRAEMDFAEQHAQTVGMKPVDKEIIPPPTVDFTPFATKLRLAEPDWVWSWATWVIESQTFISMRHLGWKGKYLAWAHIEAEDTVGQIKDPDFYMIGGNAFFSDNLPVHQEIAVAAKAAHLSYPVSQLAEGWVSAMAIEGALELVGWPATPDKMQAAMARLSIDTKGLRGGKLEWTDDNHYRKQQSYRVYRWNNGKTELAKDWKFYDVK
jgi:branched-chain amino acid transport system substrate-binding protein